MKRVLMLILLISSSYICFSQENKSVVERQKEMIAQFNQYKNEELFDFVLLNIDGEVKRLSDFKHKIILLDFWATWCGACVNHIPDQKETYQRLKLKYNSDFEWINISVDKDTLAWRDLLNSKGKAGINLIGNIDFIQNTFHIDHYPTLVLIDEKYRILGFDIARLSWGSPVFLEYLIFKGMNGINSGEAWEQMSVPGTNKFTGEYQKWYDSYYQKDK